MKSENTGSNPRDKQFVLADPRPDVRTHVSDPSRKLADSVGGNGKKYEFGTESGLVNER